MHTPMIKVLYIDDELNNLVAFAAAFRRKFQVHTASSAAEGLKVLVSEEIHVILSDQRMPVMTGIDFFESILERFPDPIRILITGYADVNAVIGAINRGQVYKYIEKPWDEATLAIFIERAYEVFNLRQQNVQLIDQLQHASQKLEQMARRMFVPQMLAS